MNNLPFGYQKQILPTEIEHRICDWMICDWNSFNQLGLFVQLYRLAKGAERCLVLAFEVGNPPPASSDDMHNYDNSKRVFRSERKMFESQHTVTKSSTSRDAVTPEWDLKPFSPLEMCLVAITRKYCLFKTPWRNNWNYMCPRHDIFPLNVYSGKSRREK